uniref:Uncharacterized protein n=1 Tax=Strix occidentalis caurina TaxID=311401 RepID=A0A8D0FDG3_STROC
TCGGTKVALVTLGVAVLALVTVTSVPLLQALGRRLLSMASGHRDPRDLGVPNVPNVPRDPGDPDVPGSLSAAFVTCPNETVAKELARVSPMSPGCPKGVPKCPHGVPQMSPTLSGCPHGVPNIPRVSLMSPGCPHCPQGVSSIPGVSQSCPQVSPQCLVSPVCPLGAPSVPGVSQRCPQGVPMVSLRCLQHPQGVPKCPQGVIHVPRVSALLPGCPHGVP